MEDWEDAVAGVGGHINFVNKTYDPIYQALSAVGLVKLRVMITGFLGESAQGIAIWGGPPGRSHLTINDGLRNYPNPVNPGDRNFVFNLYRTTRHELGHVLGLYHEHQRWDRDNFVEVIQDDAMDAFEGIFNNVKIKEKFTISLPVIKIRLTTIKSGWFSIVLLIPYIEWVDIALFKLAESVGGFDRSSIMMYHGYKFRSVGEFESYTYKWGGEFGDTSRIISTPYTVKNYDPLLVNIFISENDARTVKKNFEEWFLLDRMW